MSRQPEDTKILRLFAFVQDTEWKCAECGDSGPVAQLEVEDTGASRVYRIGRKLFCLDCSPGAVDDELWPDFGKDNEFGIDGLNTLTVSEKSDFAHILMAAVKQELELHVENIIAETAARVVTEMATPMWAKLRKVIQIKHGWDIGPEEDW